MRWQQRQNNFRTPKNHRLPRANLFGSLFSFGSRIDGEFLHSYLHHIIAAGMDAKQHLRREKDKALPTVRPYLSNVIERKQCGCVWCGCICTQQRKKTPVTHSSKNDGHFMTSFKRRLFFNPLWRIFLCQSKIEVWNTGCIFQKVKQKQITVQCTCLLANKLQSNRRIQQ